MKLFRNLLAILILTISIPAYAGFLEDFKTFAGPTQTNMYYNAGENTIELTPTLSSTGFFAKGTITKGVSLEYEHWQTLTTGTGVELGTYDIKNHPGIDHISVMEDYRLVRLPQTLLMGKFALVAKIGAETSFTGNGQNIEYGGGINYNCFEKRFRLEIDYMQHQQLTSGSSGGTVRAGMQFLF